MKYIHLVDNLLAKLETALIILILSMMILLAFLQVILRNFFSTSIYWGDILLRHLVLWIGFIGASLATREGKHINIDILSKILSPRKKYFSHFLVNLFTAVVCYFLMRAAITFISMEAASGSILFSSIPMWIAQLILAIGFGTMMFRFFIKAIEYFITFIRFEQESAV